MSLLKLLQSVLRDDRGTSAVEYGLICTLIVLAIMGAINSFANTNMRTWNSITTQVANATAQSG